MSWEIWKRLDSMQLESFGSLGLIDRWNHELRLDSLGQFLDLFWQFGRFDSVWILWAGFESFFRFFVFSGLEVKIAKLFYGERKECMLYFFNSSTFDMYVVAADSVHSLLPMVFDETIGHAGLIGPTYGKPLACSVRGQMLLSPSFFTAAFHMEKRVMALA